MTKPLSKRLVAVLAVIAVIIVLIHVTTLVFLYGFNHDNLYGLTGLFDLDGERNVPAFFSGGLLLLAVVLLVRIMLTPRPGERPRGLYWGGLALVFTFLAIDEIFEVHERVGRIAASWIGAHELTVYAWLIPYVIGGIAFLAIYTRFLLQLPPADRKRVMRAGCVYVLGAAGAEAVGAWYVHHYHTEHAIGYDVETAIEESLEMAGAILFIYALLKYIEARKKSSAQPARTK